ncbi:hypothetical protein SLS62_011177 [Diatrype stigma]|uniref:Protein kinase domain-containing protein n=1 Tax=Diatrype stigma TaxID=117547 RepID=A0AAN9YEG4_9PEZI
MDAAGLALTAIDICFKYGPLLVKLFESWRDSDTEVAERIAIVENAWAKTREQIIFVESIAPSLDAEHRRVLDNLLAILATKLSLAVTKVQGLLKTKNEGDVRPGFLQLARKVRREKYAFAKASLDEVIRDMEDWQRRFDPSWYLIVRVASPLVDRELNRVVQGNTSPSSQSTAAVGVAVRPGQRSGLSGVPGNSEQAALFTADGVRDALRPNPQHRISIFLPQQDLETINIRYSSAKVAKRKGTNAAGSGSNKWLIINSVRCPPSSDVTKLTKDVRDLARKLTQADPLHFGLLSCKGVMRVLEPATQRLRSFDMIFRVPDGNSGDSAARFQCLRESLLHGDDTKAAVKTISLSRRVRIAQELAKSISYVHTFNFVHKNIRPESILICSDAGADADPSRWCSTFLVGFENFRSADGGTDLVGDGEWARNLYRHPSRQGENLTEPYKMQHDIYSLGVCLLEIGAWEPFVEYVTGDAEAAAPHARPARLLDECQKASSATRPASTSSRDGALSELPEYCLKDQLVNLARSRLPQMMGDKYTEVVVTCLTCLDEGNDGFGDESEMFDEDGILVGVRFIEAILFRLNEIVV